MTQLVRHLFSEQRQALLAGAAGLSLFLLLTLGALVFALDQMKLLAAEQSSLILNDYEEREASVNKVLEGVQRMVRSTPCTAEFQEELRRAAFVLNSVSQILYAPDGAVRCGLGTPKFLEPVQLNNPDFDASPDAPQAIWVERALSFANLGGLYGSIILRDEFAVVVPIDNALIDLPIWLGLEAFYRGDGGVYWHRLGDVDIYPRHLVSASRSVKILEAKHRELSCDDAGRYCVATEADVIGYLSSKAFILLIVLTGIACFSVLVAMQSRTILRRHWSFESRFCRHLGPQTIHCVYQPIMSLANGSITGCEVLARWRDVDDTVVYPDRFIPIVEKCGLTIELTRLVAECAFDELSKIVPVGQRLTVAFNIFPKDLNCTELRRVFKKFECARDRFELVLEIVESEQIDMLAAQREIIALRSVGIKTYIDDFGTGYSNMQNVAALAVDGVKLDRAFAMAPSGSIMDRMLIPAIEMIQTAGRKIVVEGVETSERLEFLKRTSPENSFAQGYYISRPLVAFALFEFLSNFAAKENKLSA